MIKRTLESVIKNKMASGKALVLLGARQTGKTTLLQMLLRDSRFLFLNGDDPSVQAELAKVNTRQLARIIGDHTVVFIDEAQRIPGVGLGLKIITDRFPQVQLLVSGSSSFELTQSVNEPLTGRKWEYILYPLSWAEIENHFGYLESEQLLETRLIYGNYPEIVVHLGEERERLQQLVNSYLYRDILSFADIRKPEVLSRLLQALALQVGSEVNFTELAQITGVNKATVSNYIDILEKGFIIFRLSSLSRNLRNEIKQNRKVYFYDNGVRNMIIGNFQSLDLRSDKGALWENFLISERIKLNHYTGAYAHNYFWRTRQQQEVDYVEEKDGNITAWEFKWRPQGAKISSTFLNAYNATAKIIHRENFREFIMPQGGVAQ
ncbi:MAG: ATP-binding protein [Spirochaetales bacterium]|nr:ATP-binding protein [Spirochaetales bacterium]